MSIEFSEKDDEYDGGKIKLIKLWINKSRFVDHDEGWENSPSAIVSEDDVNGFVRAWIAQKVVPQPTKAPQPMESRAGIAPPRNPKKPHVYPGSPGHDPKDPGDCYTSDCSNGCGCWAGPSRSGGPDGIDPFGECPNG